MHEKKKNNVNFENLAYNGFMKTKDGYLLLDTIKYSPSSLTSSKCISDIQSIEPYNIAHGLHYNPSLKNAAYIYPFEGTLLPKIKIMVKISEYPDEVEIYEE